MTKTPPDDMAAWCSIGVRSHHGFGAGNIAAPADLDEGDRVSELHYDEWMTESDSVLWHIERDPLLRSTITSVWFLDSAPNRARMDAVVERIVAKIPRLRQRVRSAAASPCDRRF